MERKERIIYKKDVKKRILKKNSLMKKKDEATQQVKDM